MSHWNHRVFKQVTEHEVWYEIHEAYYEDDKKIPEMWTENAIAPGGETIEELKAELKRMIKCLDKPILMEEEVENTDELECEYCGNKKGFVNVSINFKLFCCPECKLTFTASETKPIAKEVPEEK